MKKVEFLGFVGVDEMIEKVKNEIEFSDKWKVTTIRVNRLNFESPLTEEQQNHCSETELDDFDFDYDGVKILVDSMSMQYMTGATIDYKEDLQGSNFSISNPNATKNT